MNKKPKPTVLDRLGVWFLKESGKKFVFGSAIATSIAVASLHIVPHTFLLNQFRDIVHLYKNGYTVPVSTEIKNRFKKTLDILQIPENEQKQFKPFMVYGFDIFSAGTFYSRYGVIVGIPINFTYMDTPSIDTSEIRINDLSVPWETKEAQLLLKSFKLSEKAQIYAMAREIELRKTPKYFIDTFGAVSSFIAAYGVGHHLNTKFNFYEKLRLTRFTLYGLIGSFFAFNYIFLKDFSQLYYEKKIDEKLKKSDPIFKEGGKEFYENIVNRNIALRTLMGKVGENTFTVLGNENYLIRQRHLPLVQRKEFFASDIGAL